MELADYLNSMPKLHSWDGGQSWNTGGFQPSHIKAILHHVQQASSSPRIIETGAGNSTIAFTFCNPNRVTSVNPDAGVYERIRAYCAEKSLDLSTHEMILDRSQFALPEIAKRTSTEELYDAALIDGDHGWPVAFLDFFYLNFVVKKGGIIIVDDVQLYSIRELARLLVKQPGFELVQDIGKALIFKKTTDARDMPSWLGQPYIKERSPDTTPFVAIPLPHRVPSQSSEPRRASRERSCGRSREGGGDRQAERAADSDRPPGRRSARRTALDIRFQRGL